MNGFNSKQFKYAFAAIAIGVISACGKQTSDEYIQEAQKYVAQNNPSAAIVALKNAVQIEPNSAEARFALGKLYMQQNQFDSAEKELNRALEYGYNSTEVLPLLTQAYQRTGAYSALSKLEHKEAGLTSVERAEIGYFKIVALVRLNKIDQAHLLIEELSELETSSVYKGLIAAYSLVLEEDYQQAAEAVAKLREQAPQNAEVLKLLAQLKLSLSQPADAVEIFKDYLSTYPDDTQTTFVLAKLLVDTGELSEADIYIDRLLKINDTNPLLNQFKAATNAFKGDYTNALKRAEIAILGGKDEPSVRLVAGYAAYQIKDYESANRHLSYIAGRLPDNHPGLRLLAASQLQLGLTSEVSDVLVRLDELSEKDAPLFSKASYELLRGGFEKDARLLMAKSSDISRTAEDLTRLGLLQLSLNNLDGIINLEEAISQSPKLESAQITLAKAYVATRQYDKALELAENWKSASVGDNKPFLVAGDVYLRQQKFAKAKGEFEQAAQLDSSDPAPRLALVNLAFLQKDNQQAMELLDQILIDFPNNVAALASYYVFKKQTDEQAVGIKKIQTAFASDPSNTNLRLLLVRVKMAEQDYQTAIDLLNDIKDQQDLPKGYWKSMGQSLIRTNQRREATKHYDLWLEKQPNDKDAVMGKLLLLDSQNKFSEALELVNAFLDNRDDLQMQLLNTHFLLMSGKFEEAKVVYDGLPQSVLAMPVTKGFLARFQLNDKQPKLALDNALIAYEGAPNNRNLVLLVFIYESLKEPKKALDLLSQHVEKQPKDLAAKMFLAERQIGADKASAMATYEQALQQNPNNYIASNNLAYLYMQQGDLKKAKGYAKKAVELEPKNAAALDTLAQVYVAEKDYKAALDLYNGVITEDMQNEEIYLNYVETLLLAEQKVLAKRKLEQREMQQEKSINRIEKLKADYAIK